MRRVLALGLSLLSGFALSAAHAAEKEQQWFNEGEISFVSAAGNTDAVNLAAQNELHHHFTDSLQGTWKIGALYAKSDAARTAESYATEAKLDYIFASGVFAFAAGGWQQNEFAGIERRVFGGLGAGYAFLGGPKSFLVGEIGVNYTGDRYTDATEKDYPEGRAFAKYTYAFSGKSKLSQSVEFLDDLGDTAKYRLNSETALVVALGGNISQKISYLVKHVSEPVPDSLEKTDSVVMVTLVLNL